MVDVGSALRQKLSDLLRMLVMGIMMFTPSVKPERTTSWVKMLDQCPVGERSAGKRLYLAMITQTL